MALDNLHPEIDHSQSFSITFFFTRPLKVMWSRSKRHTDPSYLHTPSRHHLRLSSLELLMILIRYGILFRIKGILGWRRWVLRDVDGVSKDEKVALFVRDLEVDEECQLNESC